MAEKLAQRGLGAKKLAHQLFAIFRYIFFRQVKFKRSKSCFLFSVIYSVPYIGLKMFSGLFSKILAFFRCVPGVKLPKYTYTLIQLPPPHFLQFLPFWKISMLNVNHSIPIIDQQQMWTHFDEKYMHYGQLKSNSNVYFFINYKQAPFLC